MPGRRRQSLSGGGWIGIILLPYAILLTLVPPVGEFPTTDDFDYAAAAWHLADTGQLTLSDWPAMTLVTHVAWGALCCVVGGNSFFVLRCGECVLSVAAAVAIYRGFLRWGHSRPLAALAAATFAVSPLTVSLQYTFMTDLTGAALCAVLIACRPPRRETSIVRLTAYGVLGGVAFLARETAAIPWAIVVAAAAGDCASRRRSLSRVAWLTAAPAVLVAAYQFWLHDFHGVPYNRTQPSLVWWALTGDPQRLVYMVSGAGLAMLPLSIVLLRWLWRHAGRRWAWLPPALGLAASAAVFAGIDVAPPYREELFDLGLRAPEAPVDRIPSGLKGPVVLLSGEPVSLFRLATTGLAWLSAGALGTTFLLGRRIRWGTDRRDREGRLPLATLTCLGTATLYLLTRGMPDRYLLSLIPAAILMVAEQVPPGDALTGGTRGGWIAAVLIGIASLIGIQDGMTRSRSFQEAINRLLSRGVAPVDIDAGLAFGGMHRFNPAYRGAANRGPYWSAIPRGQWDGATADIHPLTMTDNRRYRVSFGEEPEYRPIDSVPFTSWFRSGAVTIFERLDQNGPAGRR